MTSLSFPPSFLEVGAVVPIFPDNDLLPLTKFFQEPAHVWPSAVALQGLHEMAPIHSAIGFEEVQKNQEEWVLVEASKILSKFEIQDGCPCYPNCT